MSSIRHITVPEPPLTEADDRYLDAAKEAILAVGWSRTTLTDIARRAGVSRMTLYRRWPDTQTLLADLMTREWSRTVAAAADATGPAASSRGRVVQGVVATVQALRGDPLLRRVLEVDPEVLLPYLLVRRGRTQDALGETLAEALSAAQADGTVRPGDPVVLARSVLLAAHGFTLSAHTMIETGAEQGDDPTLAAYDEQLAVLVDRFLAPLDAPVDVS